MPDASHRRAIPEDALVRQSSDDGMAESARVRSEPETRATTDAADGLGGNLSEASDDGRCFGAPEIPVFIAGSQDHAAERGLGSGHHVHPDVARLHVLGGSDRLVQPVRFVMAIVEQPGEQFLHGSSERGVVASSSDNLQYGSRSSVHKPGVYEPIGGGRCEYQYGWERSGVGQCVHRTSVVEREVRARLPSCSPHGAVIASGIGEVSQILQSRTAPSEPGVSDTLGCVSGKSVCGGTAPSGLRKMGDGPRVWAASPLRFACAHLRCDAAHTREEAEPGWGQAL
jgi:hypothetical protein